MRSIFFIIVLLLITVSGCSRTPTVQKSSPGNLEKIQTAYMAFYDSKKRPPKSAEELAPFLKKPLDEVLVSQNDKEKYVIIWDTDPYKDMGESPVVIAYERKGVDGKRFVFHGMGVEYMTADQFSKANFPQGHTPQK